ncbi:MAG: chemotaxis protein CheX [Armatimonadota bacterium]
MDLKTELYQTAVSTFEEVGFIFLLPEMDDELLQARLEAAVSIDFDGPSCGKLVLAVHGGLMPVLAANMLGVDEPPSVDQQRDALGEIANVVCGNVLPKMAGKTSVFRITAPRAMDGEELADCMREGCAAEVQLPLEEGRADLALFVRQ